MIKLPTDEFKSQLYWEYAETSITFGESLEKYNAEILRLNEPQIPMFPNWVRYITFDESDGWMCWNEKPVYIPIHKSWYIEEDLEYCCALTSKEILWLEHINGNRPPSESIICLADYRKVSNE